MMLQPIILSGRTNTPPFFCVELTQFFHVKLCVSVCARERERGCWGTVVIFRFLGWRRGPGNVVINPGGGPSHTWIIREINLHAAYEPGEKHWRRKLYFPDRLSRRMEAATISFHYTITHTCPHVHMNWHFCRRTQESGTRAQIQDALRDYTSMHRVTEKNMREWTMELSPAHFQRGLHSETLIVPSLWANAGNPLRREFQVWTYSIFSFLQCV